MTRLTKKMKVILIANMRQSILEVSEKIIIRDGLDGLTMKQLALEAEMSAGSIYNYFQNKEEIISGIMENTFQRLLETLTIIGGQSLDAREKLRNMAVFMFADFPHVRKLHEALMHRHPPLSHDKMRNGHRLLIGILTKTIRQGIVEKKFVDQDPVLAASVFLGIIRELQFDPGKFFVDFSPESLADKFIDVYLFGIKKGAEQ